MTDLEKSVRDLCDAASDGRPVPEWLQERLRDIRGILAEVEESRGQSK